MTATHFFIDRLFNETMQLLLDMQQFSRMVQQHKNGVVMQPALRKAKMHAESLKVTTRLSYVMAWVLAQRAVSAGEITAEEARGEDFALGGHAVCMVDMDPGEVQLLPTQLAILIQKSKDLYLKAKRLDQQLARQAAVKDLAIA